MVSSSIQEGPDDRCKPGGLGESSGQSFSPLTTGEVINHQHLEIEGDSPCPATLVSAAEGSFCEDSVRQRHDSGVHKSSRRHQKLDAGILSWAESYVSTLSGHSDLPTWPRRMWLSNIINLLVGNPSGSTQPTLA